MMPRRDGSNGFDLSIEEAAMMDRGRVRTWGLAAAGLAVVGAGIGFLGLKTLGRKAVPAGASAAAKATPVDEKSSLSQISAAIGRGDGMALAILKARLEAKTEGPVPAMTEAEASEWVAALASTRAGLSRFSAYGRASAVVVASEILKKFNASPVPGNWGDVLRPSSEVLSAALADQVWEVRVAALSEVKNLWKWTPNRDLILAEIDKIAEWKAAFYDLSLARLNDPEAKVRTSAVACLGTLPLDRGAEPAVRHLTDPDPGVRLQVLISFAERAGLLSEEAILPLLYDRDAYIPPIAERVLKTRGLTPDQIGLGKLVVHPRPEMRTTAIPFLKDRTDIDPIVWLLFLSRDTEESVRLKAIEALAGRDVPEAKTRLAEMASGDASAAVRARAEKLLPPGDTTAIVLPPLPPGASGLRLKAN
jgi:hypothetical protein